MAEYKIGFDLGFETGKSYEGKRLNALLYRNYLMWSMDKNHKSEWMQGFATAMEIVETDEADE